MNTPDLNIPVIDFAKRPEHWLRTWEVEHKGRYVPEGLPPVAQYYRKTYGDYRSLWDVRECPPRGRDRLYIKRGPHTMKIKTGIDEKGNVGQFEQCIHCLVCTELGQTVPERTSWHGWKECPGTWWVDFKQQWNLLINHQYLAEYWIKDLGGSIRLTAQPPYGVPPAMMYYKFRWEPFYWLLHTSLYYEDVLWRMELRWGKGKWGKPE